MTRIRFSLSNPIHLIYALAQLVIFLAGCLIIANWNGVLGTSIGASLVAAAIAGGIIFVYVQFADDLRYQIQMLLTLGLQQAFSVRGVRIKDEYTTRLAKVNKRIDILGFGLSALRQDYARDLIKWKQRAHVRILLLDPNFPSRRNSLANQRDKEEEETVGSIRNQVKAFIDSTEGIVGKSKHGSFQIKLYKCIPSVTIFRIDDEIIWGPYLLNKQSRNTAVFIVKEGGELFKEFEKQFDAIWSSDEYSRNPPI